MNQLGKKGFAWGAGRLFVLAAMAAAAFSFDGFGATYYVATVSSLMTTEPVAFKNRAKGDYRLTAAAKGCVDAGDDAQWADLKGAVDLLGNPRKRGRHVDLGCHELALGTSVILR